MATVTNKLSPAQVAIACALYQREIDLGKRLPVPEKDVLRHVQLYTPLKGMTSPRRVRLRDHYL